MNPVVQIQNPFQCNICFEDKTGHFVKWHLPKKNTERSHQSCLDCATKLCQISFRDQARFAEKVVHCPDCRFKTRVSMMPLMSLEIVFTTFKTSILFYTSKLFCEPTTARYYRSLYPPTELTSLVDSWMLSAPTSETYLFALSHIKQLIQDGTMLPFLHEIYLKSDIMRRCGNWFLLSIYLSMCRNLHQANHTDYNHNLLISVLTLQVLFYALYNYCVHVNQMETLSQLDDSILFGSNPFRPEGVFSDMKEQLWHFSVAFTPFLASWFISSIKILYEEENQDLRSQFLNGLVKFLDTVPKKP